MTTTVGHPFTIDSEVEVGMGKGVLLLEAATGQGCDRERERRWRKKGGLGRSAEMELAFVYNSVYSRLSSFFATWWSTILYVILSLAVIESYSTASSALILAISSIIQSSEGYKKKVDLLV